MPADDELVRNPITGIAACCARRQRPAGRSAAEERDEVAPSHWPAPPVLAKG